MSSTELGEVFLVNILVVFLNISVYSQTVNLRGLVVDAKTASPLVDAFIKLKNGGETVSDRLGEFQIQVTDIKNDSMVISYLGFATTTISTRNLAAELNIIRLEEQPFLLNEVVVIGVGDNREKIKALESSMKLVKDNLFAAQTETTNRDYDEFLLDLQNRKQDHLYEKYKPTFKQSSGTLYNFFKAYHLARRETDILETQNYHKYPIVNVTHEAAVAYCEWLTMVYNSNPKRRYSTVLFRLPSLREWQLAALGYPRFQSWELEENSVEVAMPKNSTDEVGKTKRTMTVKDNEILYPWFGSYNYRNSAQNKRNCWMGNFKVPRNSVTCVINRPGGDGYEITAPVANFFPNGMGLYDVVGNVGEMITEVDKACGGSWNHPPEQSTLRSVHTFEVSDPAVGFRIFMEVIKAD